MNFTLWIAAGFAAGWIGFALMKLNVGRSMPTSIVIGMLAAIAGGELTTAAFKGGPEQLWRIDQLTDGSYRIRPKAVPGTSETLALSAVGSSMPTLAKFDPASDRQRWHLGAP